jgi:hypothetical protein
MESLMTAVLQIMMTGLLIMRKDIVALMEIFFSGTLSWRVPLKYQVWVSE